MCGYRVFFAPVRPRPLKSILVSLLKADRSPQSSCRFTARVCTRVSTGGYRSATHFFEIYIYMCERDRERAIKTTLLKS